MQVGPATHLYENQVKSYFSNERYKTENAIGMLESVTEETINNKPEALHNFLSKYDLRNITPDDLADIATHLAETGDISSNAAGELIMLARLRPDKISPFNAIQELENQFENVQRVSKTDSTLANAVKISSDALHTIYNIDDFIRGSRGGIGVDVRV